MSAFGGVVAFVLAGGLPAAEKFYDGLQLVSRAASLGGVESLISLPVHTSHYGFDEAQLREAGIDPGTARISLGVEDAADLIADVERALLSPATPPPLLPPLLQQLVGLGLVGLGLYFAVQLGRGVTGYLRCHCSHRARDLAGASQALKTAVRRAVAPSRKSQGQLRRHGRRPGHERGGRDAPVAQVASALHGRAARRSRARARRVRARRAAAAVEAAAAASASERLLEVGHQVGLVLDADRQPHHARIDAGGAQRPPPADRGARCARAGWRATRRRPGSRPAPRAAAGRRSARPPSRPPRARASRCRRRPPSGAARSRGPGATASPGSARGAAPRGPRNGAPARGRSGTGARRAGAAVRSPRRARNAACGSRQPPRTFIVARAASMRARDPTSAPPMRSLWPASALVRLCITRSAPSASGRCSSGVAKVLSTTTTRPRACAAAHTASRSTTSSVGLVGLSRISSRLRSPAAVDVRAARRRAEAAPRPRSGGSSCVSSLQRAAVERRARQHLVPGTHERQHRRAHRRHAGREHEARLGALRARRAPPRARAAWGWRSGCRGRASGSPSR